MDFKHHFHNKLLSLRISLHRINYRSKRIFRLSRHALHKRKIWAGILCLFGLILLADALLNFRKQLQRHYGIGGPPLYRTELYEVAPLESLWSIALKNKLSFDTLITVNKLKNMHRLDVGQTILIPNQDGILYEVSQGESIFAIAEQFQVPLEDLLDVNDLSRTAAKNLTNTYEIFLPGVHLSSDDRISMLGLNFIRPAKGRITCRFGWRNDPFKEGVRQYHKGLDLGCNYGTPVKAANEGQVIYAGTRGGYGKVIYLRHHSGYTTIYAHLSSIQIRRGQFVSSGQIIGRSGNSGRSTGAHLHFEVRKYGVPVDPLSVMHNTASR